MTFFFPSPSRRPLLVFADFEIFFTGCLGIGIENGGGGYLVLSGLRFRTFHETKTESPRENSGQNHEHLSLKNLEPKVRKLGQAFLLRLS